MTTRYGPTGCALHKGRGCGRMTYSGAVSHGCSAPHVERAFPTCLTSGVSTLSATCGMGGGSWSDPRETLNEARREEKRRQDKLKGPSAFKTQFLDHLLHAAIPDFPQE